MFFLLTTGRYPNQQEFDNLSNEWKQRGHLSKHDKAFITGLSRDIHPMTMLSLALLNLQVGSKFFKAYSQGTHKSKYW